MSEITLVKEWCDKEGIEQPSYSFTGFATNWVCTIDAEWLEQKIYSDNCTSKKASKQDASKQLWINLVEVKKTHYNLKDKTLMLIDGDQRVDCWTFLADQNITFDNLKITAVIGASSYAPESYDKINVLRTKTTSKDSADALILIMIGQNLYHEQRTAPAVTLTRGYKKILVVSADHILVQAAMDTDNVDWVSNVKDLKKYLETNSL